MKKYFKLSVIALLLNFTGAILITYSSCVFCPDSLRTPDVMFDMGEGYLRLGHPNLLRTGVIFLIIGFLLQIITEVFNIREGKSSK